MAENNHPDLQKIRKQGFLLSFFFLPKKLNLFTPRSIFFLPKKGFFIPRSIVSWVVKTTHKNKNKFWPSTEIDMQKKKKKTTSDLQKSRPSRKVFWEEKSSKLSWYIYWCERTLLYSKLSRYIYWSILGTKVLNRSENRTTFPDLCKRKLARKRAGSWRISY